MQKMRFLHLVLVDGNISHAVQYYMVGLNHATEISRCIVVWLSENKELFEVKVIQ